MPQNREFLTDRERLLLGSPEEMGKLRPPEKAEFSRGIREKGFGMIEYLVFLAQNLPKTKLGEKQFDKIFSSNTVELVRALIGYKVIASKRKLSQYRMAQILADDCITICEQNVRIFEGTKDVAPILQDVFGKVWFALKAIDSELKKIEARKSRRKKF